MNEPQQFEYRIGTFSRAHPSGEQPSYGLGEGDVYLTLAQAVDVCEQLRADFGEVWIERRPVNPLPWEKL